MKVGLLVSDKFSKSLDTLMKLSGIPAKAAFALRGVAKVITAEVDKYEDLRKQFIEEAAEKNEQGKPVIEGGGFKLLPEKVEEFAKKIKDLQGLEVDVPTITLSDLGGLHSLTVEDLYRLEFIVEG